MEQQYDRRFIVLEHQYGRRDVMWIPLYDYRRYVMDVKITQVERGWNTPIPFLLVLQFRYRCLLWQT